MYSFLEKRFKSFRYFLLCKQHFKYSPSSCQVLLSKRKITLKTRVVRWMLLWVGVSSFTRNTHWRCSVKVGESMVKIFRKRLWRSSLLVKLQVGLWFYYKWIPSQVFFKDYGIKFTEHLLGAISGLWIGLFSPRIIFKGFVKTQKAAGVNGIIILVNLGAVHMRWAGPDTWADSARWGDFHPSFIWNFLSHCKKLVVSP